MTTPVKSRSQSHLNDSAKCTDNAYRPKAFVVLKHGIPVTQATGRRLLDYVKERKVRYKWIKEIEFATDIPKSGTGKLLRRVLKTMEREGRNKGLRVQDVERARL